jgi:CubicO group peptidase (beta-lactamase class C family)
LRKSQRQIIEEYLMSVLADGTPEEAGMDRERIARLQDLAATWVDGVKCRTAVMLAARRGKVVFHKAFGPLTDQVDSQAVQLDSIFPVNSITKPIVSTAVMCLVEDGVIGLNRPIREYIPEICGQGTDEIEVRHVITHTSGFKEDESWEHHTKRNAELGSTKITAAENQHYYIARYLECMKDLKSHYTPGSLMHYCNHHNVLLVELIRRAAGKSPEKYIEDRIFDPLGMESATMVQDPSEVDRQVVRGIGVPAGKTPDDTGQGAEDTWSLAAPWGFIGANMNAHDLAKFGQMFLDDGRMGNRSVLSPATVYEMTRDQLPGIKAELAGHVADEASFGLGWLIQGNHRWPWSNATLIPKGTFWQSGAGGNLLWVDPKT